MKRLRRFYDRFVRMRGHPRQIALGFSLGLFIGMSPTMGFQMVIAAFCAALLGWNRWSAAAGVWITNPVTAPLVYGVNYWVGATVIQWAFPAAAQPVAAQSVVEGVVRKTPHVAAAVTVGGMVLGVPVAFMGYWLALWAVGRYRAKVKARLERTRQELREKRAKRRGAQWVP